MRAPAQAALGNLDDRGRFQENDVHELKELVESGATFDDPAEVFGPWDELTPHAQAVLRDIVERDISRRVGLWPHGALWTGAVRSARTLDRFIDDMGDPLGVRGKVVWLGERLRGAPANVSGRLIGRAHARRWASGSSVGPAVLLSALGRDPHWLIGDYVEGVRMDPRSRGYYEDRSQNIVYGFHASFDLIPTRGVMVVAEVNLEPGAIRGDLAGLWGEGLADGVIDAALDQGARRIQWVEAHRHGASDWILDLLHRGTAASHLTLEVLEDPCMPPRRTAPPGGMPGEWQHPPRPPKNSLVVRRNSLALGVDHALNHKASFLRGLSGALRRSGEKGLIGAPMTREPGEVTLPEHPGLPNLVYKYPLAMAGKGVFFMRARSAEHAVAIARQLDQDRGEAPGFFQPFYESDLLDGGVQDIRVWAFISPRDCRFLGAVRSGQEHPVPESLPEGLVEGKMPFIPKVDVGGFQRSLPAEEQGPARRATQALGEAIQDMLGRTFVTRV